MTEATRRTREVTVTWHILGSSQGYVGRVLLAEGYSTEADIPRILAIRFLDDARDEHKVIVDRVEADEPPADATADDAEDFWRKTWGITDEQEGDR